MTGTDVCWRRTLRFYLSDADTPVGRWLRAAEDDLDAAGPLPLFGDDDWDAADGATKLASAIRAAEAWRRAGLYAAADLADELDDAAPDAWRDREHDDAAWARLARWVSDRRNTPTYGELQAARSVPAQASVPPW